MRSAILLAAVALAACSQKPASEKPAEPAQAAAPRVGEVDAEVPREPPLADQPIAPMATEAPKGTYRLDKSHASLVFSVNHIGFSNYTGAFEDFDATLEFDPQNPAAMRVEAMVNPASLDIPAPPEGFLAELIGPDWLNAAAFPQMTFRSTSVDLVSPDTARVAGDLTFRGVTAPVAMEVTFNGGYAGFDPYDPNARIGFSAKGALNRSAFGMTVGLPPEGSTMGVGDAVTFAIETEFTGPPLAKAE